MRAKIVEGDFGYLVDGWRAYRDALGLWHVKGTNKLVATYVAEVALGRPLYPTEDVLYLDGDPHNFDQDNLVVYDRRGKAPAQIGMEKRSIMGTRRVWAAETTLSERVPDLESRVCKSRQSLAVQIDWLQRKITAKRKWLKGRVTTEQLQQMAQGYMAFKCPDVHLEDLIFDDTITLPATRALDGVVWLDELN